MVHNHGPLQIKRSLKDAGKENFEKNTWINIVT